jgi:hypothetical protein
MRFWTIAFAVCTCTGCTMMSLERNTVAQVDSAIDLRYREVMENLARVAADPAALPSYATIFTGTAVISDTEELISTTMWQHVKMGAASQNGFASEAANPQLVRNVNLNWTINPVVEPEKLEAARAAFQWAIGGPQHVNKDSMSLLISAAEAPRGLDRHFGVADKLAQLPRGWLCVGCLRDVPKCAAYKAHCGDTWVWVMPDGMKGLSEFTLIIQSIGRVDLSSPTLFNLPYQYTPIQFETPDSKMDNSMKTIATLYVDPTGQLVTDVPLIRNRLDYSVSDARLRSLIAATASAPH